MVLILDNNSDITMIPSAVKSLDAEPPKRLSLLVDYSKRKANVNTAAATKKELFKDVKIERSPVEILQDAVTLSSMCQDNADPLNESFTLDDVRPVSFRVRKTHISRSKSFDERKISSYNHLQNSIRSALLMQAEEEADADEQEPEESDSSSIAENRRASAPVDRRAQLANARRKQQSMRSLSTCTTTASSSSCKSPPPPPVPRRIRNRDPLSKSCHAPTVTTNRRAGLAAMKCKSCRNVMKRSKSLQESSSNLHSSITFLSDHSPTKRSSTTGGSRRGSLMKAQTMSRRDLLVRSMEQRQMEDTSMEDGSNIFNVGAPRIRRLDVL